VFGVVGLLDILSDKVSDAVEVAASSTASEWFTSTSATDSKQKQD